MLFGASVGLHYGSCSWILHLEFGDKHKLICLLHVCVASGTGLSWTSYWNVVSVFRSTAAKTLLNKKPDGVKVSCFAQWRKCFVSCIIFVGMFSVWEAILIIITTVIMHFALNNIIIQGQSLKDVGNGYYFLSFPSFLSLFVAYVSGLIILFLNYWSF